jgi:hypothetical protein
VVAPLALVEAVRLTAATSTRQRCLAGKVTFFPLALGANATLTPKSKNALVATSPSGPFGISKSLTDCFPG